MRMRLLLLIFLYPLLCGFTFDYDVLTQCEKKHPNDFIARVVCNNKLEKEKKAIELEAKQQQCEFSQRAAVEKKLVELGALFDIRSPMDITKAKQLVDDYLNLKNDGAELRTKEGNKKILIFNVKYNCDSGKYILANLHFNNSEVAEYLAVWSKDIKTKESTRLNEFEWGNNLLKKRYEKCLANIAYITSYEDCSYVNQLDIAKAKILLGDLRKFAFDRKNQIGPNSTAIQKEYFYLIELFAKELKNNIVSYEVEKSKTSENIEFVFKSKVARNSYISDSFKVNFILKNSSIRITDNFDSIDDTSITDLLYSPNTSAKSNNSKEEVSKNYSESQFSILILGFLLFGVVAFYLIKFLAKKAPIKEASSRMAETNFQVELKSLDQSKDSRAFFSNEEYSDSRATEDFKAKNPFVMIEVPPSMRDAFIKECIWLEKKMGNFPSQEEQINILQSLMK